MFPFRLLSWLLLTPVFVRFGDSSAMVISSVASFRSSSVSSIAFSHDFPVASGVTFSVVSSSVTNFFLSVSSVAWYISSSAASLVSFPFASAVAWLVAS